MADVDASRQGHDPTQILTNYNYDEHARQPIRKQEHPISHAHLKDPNAVSSRCGRYSTKEEKAFYSLPKQKPGKLQKETSKRDTPKPPRSPVVCLYRTQSQIRHGHHVKDTELQENGRNGNLEERSQQTTTVTRPPGHSSIRRRHRLNSAPRISTRWDQELSANPNPKIKTGNLKSKSSEQLTSHESDTRFYGVKPQHLNSQPQFEKLTPKPSSEDGFFNRSQSFVDRSSRPVCKSINSGFSPYLVEQHNLHTSPRTGVKLEEGNTNAKEQQQPALNYDKQGTIREIYQQQLVADGSKHRALSVERKSVVRQNNSSGLDSSTRLTKEETVRSGHQKEHERHLVIRKLTTGSEATQPATTKPNTIPPTEENCNRRTSDSTEASQDTDSSRRASLSSASGQMASSGSSNSKPRQEARPATTSNTQKFQFLNGSSSGKPTPASRPATTPDTPKGKSLTSGHIDSTGMSNGKALPVSRPATTPDTPKGKTSLTSGNMDSTGTSNGKAHPVSRPATTPSKPPKVPNQRNAASSDPAHSDEKAGDSDQRPSTQKSVSFSREISIRASDLSAYMYALHAEMKRQDPADSGSRHKNLIGAILAKALGDMRARARSKSAPLGHVIAPFDPSEPDVLTQVAPKVFRARVTLENQFPAGTFQLLSGVRYGVASGQGLLCLNPAALTLAERRHVMRTYKPFFDGDFLSPAKTAAAIHRGLHESFQSLHGSVVAGATVTARSQLQDGRVTVTVTVTEEEGVTSGGVTEEVSVRVFPSIHTSGWPSSACLQHPLPKQKPHSVQGMRLLSAVQERIESGAKLLCLDGTARPRPLTPRTSSSSSASASAHQASSRAIVGSNAWTVSYRLVENYTLEKLFQYDFMRDAAITNDLLALLHDRNPHWCLLTPALRRTLLLWTVKRAGIEGKTPGDWFVAFLQHSLKVFSSGFCPQFFQPNVNLLGGVDRDCFRYLSADMERALALIVKEPDIIVRMCNASE